MGHNHKGNYAKKHPDAKLNPETQGPIQEATRDGLLFCASAHRIAKSLGFTPGEIGVQADLLELRIAKCQLGLFGYAPNKKNLDPDVVISDDLKAQILKAQTDGRIDCLTCWKLASKLNISRIDMGSACEKLEIRIKPCQLGAF